MAAHHARRDVWHDVVALLGQALGEAERHWQALAWRARDRDGASAGEMLKNGCLDDRGRQHLVPRVANAGMEGTKPSLVAQG